MLMLDEPTPAMDPRAEHLMIRRFKQLAKGKAAVFVTHTWRTLASRTASSSSGGRIVESGNFDSLPDASGLFAELYELAQDR